jgi:site-specific recombinase XerD
MNKGNVKTTSIQKIIGHADYSTTANIYTHTNIAELKNDIEKI